ncbi:twin transmembrane helix small protein [Hyphobacterium marinum]|uniref:Twin transmembrane helix small protein n=1 Tax=Hyphobacterium marinum TaxID=3116574 RepID=A0ABU7LXN6_9PROT|nr:twin transmembrane helix small protein [Hyphobacterium sp. Y6023]MEE2566317.1 twin transmembrane helix small protein [Hyphobacterium sp. Y6023]
MIMALNILIGVAVLAVAATLLAGLFNLARGGEGAGERSNKLMRWRVGLQFVAIALLVVGFIAKTAIQNG